MSVQALTCAFAMKGLSASEKLVLLALANYANERMQCWPSQETLAQDTELSPRTIWSALQALERDRMISRLQRTRADGTRASDVITLHFAGEVTPNQLANLAKSARKSCEDSSQMAPNQLATVARLSTFEPSPEEEPSEANANASTQADDFPSDAFARWYAGYPHKVGRGDAERSFAAVRRRREATFAELTAGRDRYVSTKPPDRSWCNPATWLNQKRWLDEPAPEVIPTNGQRPRSHQTRSERNMDQAFAGAAIAADAWRPRFGDP